MFDFIYPISYLICLTGLILWFYFKENISISRKVSSLFFISLLIYLISLTFTQATLSYKILILLRDMLILAVISQLFNYIRKNSLLVFVLAIAIYGLIQFKGFSMLYNTFPQVVESASAASDDFELLVETKNGTIPKSYDKLIKKYDLVVERAFTPSDPSLSRLDEFVKIGIPDASEGKMKTIIRELRRLSGTAYIEYNETITLEVREGETTTPAVNARHVNDPLVSQQWGWDVIQGDQLQGILSSSNPQPKKRAVIAIIDSGVDGSHPDLVNQFLTSGVENDTDPLGHGTHCAGIE